MGKRETARCPEPALNTVKRRARAVDPDSPICLSRYRSSRGDPYRNRLRNAARSLLGPLPGLPIPLLAAQILWINLLTHCLTGVALGAEPAGSGTMRQAPRPPEQGILGDGLWQRVLRLGLRVTAVGPAAGAWSDHSGYAWQSVLFPTPPGARLGVVTGLRTRLLSRANPFLPITVLASAAPGLGQAGVYVPMVQDLPDTHALPAGDLPLPLAGAIPDSEPPAPTAGSRLDGVGA